MSTGQVQFIPHALSAGGRNYYVSRPSEIHFPCPISWGRRGGKGHYYVPGWSETHPPSLIDGEDWEGGRKYNVLKPGEIHPHWRKKRNYVPGLSTVYPPSPIRGETEIIMALDEVKFIPHPLSKGG